MAHSYIYAEIGSGIERRVAVPDGALDLFMYFFNEVAESQIQPNSQEGEICEHYKIELLEKHSSFKEALLQEISQDEYLKDWYLSMLFLLESRIDSFGNCMDNQYLNQIPELLIGYVPGTIFREPVPTSILKNLINDIYWVLNEGERTPSGQYKWFEENIL
jgi:hypothetical protein